MRTFYFDPSFTLDRKYPRPGAVAVAAGTRKNPLRWCRCPGTCCSSMPATRVQVGAPGELIALYRGRVKPILVGGAYLDLMQSWHLPVHYDQRGPSPALGHHPGAGAGVAGRAAAAYRRIGGVPMSAHRGLVRDRRRARLRGRPQPRRRCDLHRFRNPI